MAMVVTVMVVTVTVTMVVSSIIIMPSPMLAMQCTRNWLQKVSCLRTRPTRQCLECAVSWE